MSWGQHPQRGGSGTSSELTLRGLPGPLDPQPLPECKPRGGSAKRTPEPTRGAEGRSEIQNTGTTWPQQYQVRSSSGENGEDSERKSDAGAAERATSTEAPSDPRQLRAWNSKAGLVAPSSCSWASWSFPNRAAGFARPSPTRSQGEGVCETSAGEGPLAPPHRSSPPSSSSQRQGQTSGASVIL